MQKIVPCLWFNNNAEEAVKFYVSLLPNSKLGKILRYDEASAKVSGMPKGSVLTIEFTLAGQEYLALNGGPIFKFTEAVSFIINCTTQKEIDFLWKKLTGNGGMESACGWLKDRYGLSWQITPIQLPKMLQDKDPKKAQNVMKAMMQMKKLDIKKLEAAYKKK